MTIQPGEKIPEAKLFEMDADGPQSRDTLDLFAGRTVVVFGVPGAFTPTCTAQHLPGFVRFADQIKAKGIDDIICMAVNDAFVMAAWGNAHNADGKVRMLADGSADFTKKTGLELDLTDAGLGLRCKRFLMVVSDGQVERLAIDDGPLEHTSAEALLASL